MGERTSSPPETLPERNPTEQARQPASGGLTRRGFLKGAGITAAGTALLDGLQGVQSQAAETGPAGVKEYGPNAAAVTLRVNGRERAVHIEPRTTLAEALRVHLGMTGTKISCDRGVCSSCTVWLDKMPVNSCMTLALDAVGHEVTTIEGLSEDLERHAVIESFVRHDALQCGFCTPGMVMSSAALLERNPHPTEADVRMAVSGNLCRCGTYPKVFAAVLDAAGRHAQKA
ncbi:MAG TPA: (2Fe-2S)-binding protein [Terracidiphilus sp.]|nr:(2Fe-2S)-binding protein [Terracidiphilus sp.]